MNTEAINPGYPPRRAPAVNQDLRRSAPWITLSFRRFHAIVTAISPHRDRDFTAIVTDVSRDRDRDFAAIVTD